MQAVPIPRKLRESALGHHARHVRVPAYNRSGLTPAVVHLSVGSFHRSHQALYFDRLAQRGLRDWGVVGVGLRRRHLHDALVPQDRLYTLVERGLAGDRATVVGVLGAYLYGPDDPAAVVRTLASAATRLVTLTVTGAGYHVDPASGAFDPADPEVRADLAAPSRPRSALGYLVEALERRRRAGLPGLTVLSCDNMDASGRVARDAVLAFAALRDERLATWIARNVSFPNSMVDRITPATTDADRAFVARAFGVADRCPVVTEEFSQWVIEDDFSAGRPPLEDVGVQFAADVRPYALLKTRLLNAGHCALGYLASSAGHRHAHDAVADPVFGGYLAALMREEIAPLLPAVPGVDVAAYRASVLDRLQNRKISDELSRLCRSGSTKVPAHVLPSIVASRRAARPHPLLTLCVAGWCRHLRGDDLAVDDPRAGRLGRLATATPGDARPLLGERAVFGALSDDPEFAQELHGALRVLDERGARAAIAATMAAGQALAA